MFDNSDTSERIETVRLQRTDQLLTCNICSKMLYSCKSRGKTGFSSAKTLLSIFSKGTASRENRNRAGSGLKSLGPTVLTNFFKSVTSKREKLVCDRVERKDYFNPEATSSFILLTLWTS
jgi:hypothetical protein